MNLILSEWTKLRSTRSFWWTSAAMIIVAGIYGALFGWLANTSGMPYTPLTVVSTVSMTCLLYTSDAADEVRRV